MNWSNLWPELQLMKWKKTETKSRLEHHSEYVYEGPDPSSIPIKYSQIQLVRLVHRYDYCNLVCYI